MNSQRPPLSGNSYLYRNRGQGRKGSDQEIAAKAKGKLATAKPGDTERAAIVQALLLHPSVQAAITLKEYTLGDADLMVLVKELDVQAKAANDGDLGRAEGMLMVQAHTLDAIFNSLARRAAMNMGEYMAASETYLRLALKAQSQCRATLETLAAVKNPQPVAFVRQANIAAGPQQINNSMAPPAGASCARETEIRQSKLSEGQS